MSSADSSFQFQSSHIAWGEAIIVPTKVAAKNSEFLELVAPTACALNRFHQAFDIAFARAQATCFPTEVVIIKQHRARRNQISGFA
jgi:hypothetical protein